MARRFLLCLLIGGLAVWALPRNEAHAGPLCNDVSVFPVSLAAFESCVVEDDQDTLPSVQAALDGALTDSIVLSGVGSFSPGPESSGEEFAGSDPAKNFVIDPDDLNNTTFTFEELPAGTLFVVLKQQNDYEIFKVPDSGVPFTVTHQLAGEDTSHISTFVPEPTTALLLTAGLVGLASRRRKS